MLLARRMREKNLVLPMERLAQGRLLLSLIVNFYGFWGRIGVARDWERYIDNPSKLERSVSTGKTFILPLSTIMKNSSLYGFWGRICAAGEEIWINPSILQ